MMLNGLLLRMAAGAACVAAACVSGSPPAFPEAGDEVCTVAGEVAPLDGVPEASGLTLSLRTPGLLWSHNDSGVPAIFAVDASGAARGRVLLPNAAVEDWEAIASARCPSGHCLYVADIGDNDRQRRHVTLYRLPEPAPDDRQAARLETFTATYPDGPHDAEGLVVTAEDVFVVTKDEAAGVYRFPRPLRSDQPMTLERVATLPLRLVTDASVSADGRWVVVRTEEEVHFFRPDQFARGEAATTRMSVRGLREPQGEGVALDADGTLYLASEGGRAGTLRVLHCPLPD